MTKNNVFSFILAFTTLNAFSYNAFAAYYYGPMTGENPVPGKFVVIKGEPNVDTKNDWTARSVLPQDLEKIKSLVTSYGKSDDAALRAAAVYLYQTSENQDPLDITQKWFDRHLARTNEVEGSNTKPGPYQWLWFQAGNRQGLIMIERMPRAVTDPEKEGEILELYKKMGAMDLADANGEPKVPNLEYLGNYRPLKDQAILEVRILPNVDADNTPLDPKLLANMLQTLTQFFHTMLHEYFAPFYPTDTSMDHPGLVFSYAQHLAQHPGFETAQFSRETSVSFNDYFPEENRSSEERSVYYKRFNIETYPYLAMDTSLSKQLSDLRDIE